VEPFLGFGQFNAVITGVMAARSIAHKLDINSLLSNLRKKSQELSIIRPLLDNATNKDLDRLLTIMKTPGLRSFVYKTDIDIIKLLSKGINLTSKKPK
jgi:digeranylgeranylglycerophospholipid reductase